MDSKIKFISLGGGGACGIRMKIEKILNQPSYIYDWLVSSQDFIIDTIFDYKNFIDFSNTMNMNIQHPYHFNLDKNYIDAFALHHNFEKKNKLIFENRFNRLQDTLKNYKCVLIRLMIDKNNDACIVYSKNINNIEHYTDNNNKFNDKYELKTSFKNYVDEIDKWQTFYKNITTFYKNNDIILILFGGKKPQNCKCR